MLGVAVSGPSVEELAGLTWLPHVYLSPTIRNGIKLLCTIDSYTDTDVRPMVVEAGSGIDAGRYDAVTGERLLPPVLGRCWPHVRVMTLAYAAWLATAVDHLRRLGDSPG